ncbi:MAG: hypothetical protein HC915_15485 [Anaerolineae bacterium]|nr:hypothetical protein [Anaerolineae bacterium]
MSHRVFMIIAVSVLYLLANSPAFAQSATPDPLIAAPPSERYTLSLPMDFVAARAPAIEIQGVFPSEALTIADTPALLEAATQPGFDPLAGLPGGEVLLLGTLLYRNVAHSGGLTPESLVASLLNDLSGAEPELEGVEIAGGSGVSGSVTGEDQHIQAQVLETPEEHLLLLVGYSSPARRADLAGLIASVQVAEANPEALLALEDAASEIEFLPGAVIALPREWWLLALDAAGMMAFAEPGAVLLQALNTPQVAEVSGGFMLLREQEYTALPLLAYDEDGRIDAEYATQVLELAGLLSMENGARVSTIGAWENAHGLIGLALTIDLSATQGTQTYVVLADSGERLFLLAGIATPDRFAQYQAFFAEVFATVRVSPAE